MNDLLHEQLSALIDGELPAAETTLLLKRLDILFGSTDVLGFFNRTTGSTDRGGSPADVRGADRFAAQEGAKDQVSRNHRMFLPFGLQAARIVMQR